MCLNTSTKHSPTETQLAVIAINRVTAWPAAVLYHRHGVDRRRGDPENEVLTLITLLGICKKITLQSGVPVLRASRNRPKYEVLYLLPFLSANRSYIPKNDWRLNVIPGHGRNSGYVSAWRAQYIVGKVGQTVFSCYEKYSYSYGPHCFMYT